MSAEPTRRPFTGRHMTMILVAFFGVVIAVNFTMARFAMSTFGGKVVENSYVASQHYNEWLKRAAVQDRLGWEKTLSLDAARHVQLQVLKQGKPLSDIQVTATLSHPLGRANARPIHFAAQADGSLRSLEALPAGRWRLELSIHHGNDEARYREDLQ